MLRNQINSVNHLVSVFAGNIQCKFSMFAFNEILFYISYLLCLVFRLCSSMIAFCTSLEVITLAFLKNNNRYVCCIFANLMFVFERKAFKKFSKGFKNVRKDRVMCILQTQSVTFIPLVFLLSS